MSRSRRSTPGQSDENVTDVYNEIRQDYVAATSNRWRRARTGLDGTADDHYFIENKFFKVIEFVRDMDRNDGVVGQMVDRACENIIQCGFTLDVRTGNPEIDKELLQRWNEWAEDPDLCDSQGEHQFYDMEWAVCRAAFVDGDQWAGGQKNGTIKLLEADRARTPSGVRNNRRTKSNQIIHGVELDSNRKRIKLHWTRQQSRHRPKRLADMNVWDFRDADGHRQVFQIYDAKRITQTRGVSAFVPVFDLLGMFEDLNFAKVVQAQIVSCMAIFLETDVAAPTTGPDVQLGERTEKTNADGSIEIDEKLTPGMMRRLPIGVKANGFSPNIPNAEFFQHVKLILQIIGLNLGLPLVEVLMDASETNFSGYRGAENQAQRGFRRKQKKRVEQFHSPIYRFKVRQWMDEDSALKAALEKDKIKILGHIWHKPSWPYIEPSKDAKANTERIKSNQVSPRGLQAELGKNWDDVSTEIVQDNGILITKAVDAAAEVNKAITDPAQQITWRDLLTVGQINSTSRQASNPTNNPQGQGEDDGE